MKIGWWWALVGKEKVSVGMRCDKWSIVIGIILRMEWDEVSMHGSRRTGLNGWGGEMMDGDIGMWWVWEEWKWVWEWSGLLQWVWWINERVRMGLEVMMDENLEREVGMKRVRWVWRWRDEGGYGMGIHARGACIIESLFHLGHLFFKLLWLLSTESHMGS